MKEVIDRKRTRRHYLALCATVGTAAISGCVEQIREEDASLGIMNQRETTISGIITVQSERKVLESRAFRLDSREYQDIYSTDEATVFGIQVQFDGETAELRWDPEKCRGAQIRFTQDGPVSIVYAC